MTGRVAKAVRRALLVGVIALAALGGGALWLANSDWGQRWAATQIAAALGPSVRFHGIDVTLWPPPLSVVLDGVELLGGDGVPIARARSVMGRVRLRALVGRPPFVALVQVDDFEADISRSADGELRFGGRTLGGGGDHAAAPALDASCPRVALHDGRVTIRDDRAGDQLQIEGITGSLVPTRPGARASLSGHSAQLGDVRLEATLDSLGGIATAPFHAELEAREADAGDIAAWLPRAGDALKMSGRGRLTANLSGRPTACQADIAVSLASGAIAWRDVVRATAPIAVSVQGGWGHEGLTNATGEIDVAHVQAAGIEGRGLHASLSADATGVTLHDGRCEILGGQWRQSGTVRLADGVTLDGAVDADAVDGAALTAALHQLVGDAVTPLDIAGPVGVHAAVSGAVGSALIGQLAVSMAEGTGTWKTTSATAPLSLSADVAAQAGTFTITNGNAQIATASDRDLTASAVDLRFAFSGDTVQVNALSAQAFDGNVTASGTVPLNNGAPNITLSAVGINAAHLARAFLTGRREDTGTAGDVDVTATLRGGTGTIALRLASASMTAGGLQIFQPATASGTLRWRSGAVQVTNGRAQLNRVRLANTDVGNVRANFASAGPGHLKVSPLTARAFGGLWTVSATLARDEVDGTVRAAAVNLDPILAALDAGPRSDGATATIDATVRRPRQGATSADLTVQLSRGRFLFQDLTVTSPARGTATVRVDGSRWSVENGVVSAAAVRYSVLHGTQATASLGFDPARIQFADLRFTAAGAPWQGSGEVGLDAPPRIDGTLAVKRANPDAVLAMVGIKAPTLDPDGLDLSLRARSTLDDTWRQALQGSGSLALRGGYLASTALLRAIFVAVVPSRTLRDGGTPNRLTSLTQTFTLADGLIHTDDLTVDSDDYDLTAAGTIGLEGQLDLYGRVTLTPHGIKKVFALGAVPIPGSSLLSLPVIPARFEGNLDNPSIHPEAGALAGSTARWFADALIGTPRLLGQGVGRVFSDMRNFVDPRAATPTPSP